jgi:UDP-N-acetylbacillosamine N-acetyltransferase
MTSSEVNVLGSGGHARSVIALLGKNAVRVAAVYDDAFKSGADEKISGILLSGKEPPQGKELVLALGDNKKREEAFKKYAALVHAGTVVHPSAQVEKSVIFGRSNLVFASCVINAEAKLGDNNIVNTCAVIEHESVIGDHNHISVGAILCGRVKIGSRCFIGAGTVVIDKISICDEVTVGAGSVVVKDITEPGTYAGNPAKKIK